MPGIGFLLTKDGRKQVFLLSREGCTCMPPGICDKVLPFWLQVCRIDRRSFFLPGIIEKRRKKIVVGRTFQHFQDSKKTVCFQIFPGNIEQSSIQGNIADYGELQHPPVKIFPDTRISDSGIQITGFKIPHFPERIFRRGGADFVQQFIEIKEGKGSGRRRILSFSKVCAPGKISPKLTKIKIMIGGKIVKILPRPRSIIFILFHELSLPVKTLTFLPEGPVPVFVETEHLADRFRNISVYGSESCGKGWKRRR